MSSPTPSIFPPQTPTYILSFQFSSWYPRFASLSIKSTIIRPLSEEFREYLDADGVFVPEGSEDVPAESTLSDNEDDEDGDDEDEADEAPKRFAFPDLDAQIRACVQEYRAVFPKLNFSAPRDAAWILPALAPLKCTSPADVYLLLKSSDFVAHDLHPTSVFDGCAASGPEPEPGSPPAYALELVLRKWHPVDRSRELRCFVRHNTLLGISQRDTNYYDFLNAPATRAAIVSAVHHFWAARIKPLWGPSIQDYTFDLLLTRDLARAHVLDFNPYAPRTDALLFTYAELHALLATAAGRSPEFRVIDSRSHPAANSNAPAHQHNMVPFEALTLSSGRDIEEFADIWKAGIDESMRDSDSDD